MRHNLTMVPWLLYCGASLTACQNQAVLPKLVELPPPAVPQRLLERCASPTRPPPGATQRDAALVITDFQEALAACNADKDAIAEIVARH